MEAPQAAPDAQPQIDIGGDDDFSALRSAIQQAPEAKQADPVMDSVKPKPAEKAPKQEAKPAEKADKQPKSLKDKLKVEDEPIEEETTDEAPEGEEDDIPTYKDRVPTDKEKATWKGLKQTKAEYDKLKPEFEKMKAEYEEFKKKPVFDDEVTKELDELRRFRDMTDFKLSETYQKEIAAPQAAIERDIVEIATEFKIDQAALGKAFTEISEWKRNLAIEKVLRESDEEVPSAITKTILDKAAKMHDIWQKEAQLEEDAGKNRAAYEYEQKQKVTKQTLEEQKAWQSALDSSTQMIETQMAPLLKNMPKEQRQELMSALKEAKIADTPEDRALQAQAPHLAAVLIEQLNSMKKEMAELKKANKALSVASPSSNGRQAEAKKADADDDEDGLFKAIRSQQGY
jgi:hypothetical protein